MASPSLVSQHSHVPLSRESRDRTLWEASVQPPLRSASDDRVRGVALFELASANLAHLSEGHVGVPMVPRHAMEEAFRRDENLLAQLRDEVQKQIKALSVQQLAAAPQHPVQIVVENRAMSNVLQMTQGVELQKPDAETCTNKRWWTEIVTLPAHRFALFSVIHLSLYFAYGYLNHQQRLAELQMRIDANAFLWFQKILNAHFESLAGMSGHTR